MPHTLQVQTELRTHGALQPVPGLLIPTVAPTAAATAGAGSSTAATAAGGSGSASSSSSISGISGVAALQSTSLELNQNLDPSKPPALSADMLHEQLAAAGLGPLLDRPQPTKVSLYAISAAT